MSFLSDHGSRVVECPTDAAHVEVPSGPTKAEIIWANNVHDGRVRIAFNPAPHTSHSTQDVSPSMPFDNPCNNLVIRGPQRSHKAGGWEVPRNPFGISSNSRVISTTDDRGNMNNVYTGHCDSVTYIAGPGNRTTIQSGNNNTIWSFGNNSTVNVYDCSNTPGTISMSAKCPDTNSAVVTHSPPVHDWNNAHSLQFYVPKSADGKHNIDNLTLYGQGASFRLKAPYGTEIGKLTAMTVGEGGDITVGSMKVDKLLGSTTDGSVTFNGTVAKEMSASCSGHGDINGTVMTRKGGCGTTEHGNVRLKIARQPGSRFDFAGTSTVGNVRLDMLSDNGCPHEGQYVARTDVGNAIVTGDGIATSQDPSYWAGNLGNG